MAEKTPMRRQYEEIKSRYPDCMLLFRLGDFYEMFDEDAQTAADELDLMLTTRDRNKPPEEQIPMCGVPYHAANSYIKKLIDHGHKVAVCDQLEDPALTKGLVKRDVIRVITPGTVTDEGMLDYERPNYLCALWLDGRLQSRTYLKTIGETTQERTAFEISITCLAFPEELPQETDLR